MIDLFVSRKGKFLIAVPSGCGTEVLKLADSAEALGWTESLCRVPDGPEDPDGLEHSREAHAGFARYLVVRSPYERLAALYEEGDRELKFAKWLVRLEADGDILSQRRIWIRFTGDIDIEGIASRLIRRDYLIDDLGTVFDRHGVDGELLESLGSGDVTIDFEKYFVNRPGTVRLANRSWCNADCDMFSKNGLDGDYPKLDATWV